MKKNEKIGPTGEYPRGSLGSHDDGALNIGVAHDSKGNVVVNFGSMVSWFAMPQENAINFARLILRHAGAKKVEIEL
jgi:hypothetical protein